MTTKYTAILESKLPAYIRDDPAYSRFIEFFTAYYQWFDDTYDIYGLSDKLDIDNGFKDFYSYYAADFLPYFPDVDTIAADKVKLIKIIRELYQSKGIPDSFKFLFRALYNTNIEIYDTSQYVLKASDGKWIVPKSIKIKSLDVDFLNINNFKVLGLTSKSIGIIEKSKINGKFTQIYLSNIQRLFTSGETIKILDYDNKDVYFLNGKYVHYDRLDQIPTGAVLLTSKIIGSISNIDIVSTRRGKYYKVGDPVVITDGFSNGAENPIGAIAQVSEVTTGQILNVVITDGGYGYNTFPNTTIDVVKSDGNIDSNANCIVSVVDTSKPANVAYISNDCIEDNLFITLGNTSFNFSKQADANTTLQNCFSFVQFATYPIIAVSVRNGGGGYEEQPILNFNSVFVANTVSNYPQHLESLGILAPIQIVDPGLGYTANDTLAVSGGDGNFAYAKINSVNTAGAITSVSYYNNANTPYSLGGMGYNNLNLPIVTVNSSLGANAQLIIPAILASGAEYTLETDKIGAITKIVLTETGEDYVKTPNVSLRVKDIVVTGNYIENINATNIIYQGTLENPTFICNINLVTTIYYNLLTNDQLFSVRIYDFKGNINPSQPLIVYDTDNNITVTTLTLQSNYTDTIYKNGIKSYGDGSAVATAKFLNGLIVDTGRYLNADGQLSAHSILQNDVYNSSTYILSTEKDYESYKTTIKNLLHPIGTNLITRNLLKSNTQYKTSANSSLNTGKALINANSEIIIQNNNSVFSNTILINSQSNLSSLFSANDRIYILGDTNLNLFSTITNINFANNIITLEDYVQYKYVNAYSGYTNANTLILTNANYPNSKYSVNSFISIGDSVITANNLANTVINIINNTLYFANNLNLSGTNTNTANVTLIKKLTSNNITTYKSV